MKPSIPRSLAFIMLLGVLFVTAASSGSAQLFQWDSTFHRLHPELFVTIQDSITIYLVAGNGDTIKADEVNAAYVFDMLYDSTSLIMYTFTDCVLNGERIKLAKWINDRTVNANAALLSYNSTTDTFNCHAGDTLSFYREARWRDPRTGWSDTNSYYARDSLDYAVELVRLSDSTRITLLDSIGMLPSLTPSRPVVHGMHPLMALVHYVIPCSLEGTEAFIRVRVYHRGDGEYWFTRHDWFNVALSARLQDSVWNRFIHLFSPGAPKIVTHMAEESVRAEDNSNLVVTNVAGSPRDIRIAFDGASDGGGTAIVIYDALGEALFIPYMTPGSVSSANASYHFDQPGVYFVGLLHGNHITAFKKVIIN